jgi:hypothetical protein
VRGLGSDGGWDSVPATWEARGSGGAKGGNGDGEVRIGRGGVPSLCNVERIFRRL